MRVSEVRTMSLRRTVALAIAILTLFATGTARAQVVNYGTYIVTSVHSGLAITDPGASNTDGRDLEQQTVTNATSQQWVLTSVGTNQYTLTNASSGQFLDVAGASHSSGALVDQWPADGNANQTWTFISLGGSHYELTSLNSGLALAVLGGGTGNGADLEQSTYTGSASQQWIFTPVAAPDNEINYGCLTGPHPGYDPTSTLGPPSGNCLVDPTVEGYTGVRPVQGATGTTTFQLTALASGNWNSAGVHTIGNYQIGHSTQLPDQQVAYFEFNFASVQGRTVTAAFFLIPGSTDYDIGVVYPARCAPTGTPCFKAGIRPLDGLGYSVAQVVDASSNHNTALAAALIGNQNEDLGYWPWISDGLHLNTEFGAFTYNQSELQDEVNAGGDQVILGADDFDSGESNLSGGGLCPACPGGYENYIWGSTGYNTGIIFLLTVDGGEASIPVVPNGTYEVKNLNSGGALEVAGKTAIDEHLDVVAYGGVSNQMWKVTRLANGNYSIRNAGTGSPLQAGAEWSIIPATGGNYTLKSVKTGMMLDVVGGSSLMGMGVVQMPAKPGYANQQWSFSSSNANQEASLTINGNINRR